MDAVTDDDLRCLVAEREIRAVLARYCRGIDRLDLDLVRSCYHPDATDDHGRYRGGVDGFIDWVIQPLSRFERTMHFLGTSNIEFAPGSAEAAVSETYAVAYHRGTRPDGVLADHIVGLRYLDRFEWRAGAGWRIAERICALEWRRDDPVAGPGDFPTAYTMGERGAVDPLYRLLGELGH